MAEENASGNGARIPTFLRELDRWCLWDTHRTESGKLTKKPRGSLLNPEICQPVEKVIRAASPGGGVGFVMTGGVDVENGRLIAFDLDGCRCPKTGMLSEWAQEILDHHGRSYTEITPSGTGLRQWLIVRDPPGSVPIIRPPFPAPPGVEKKPEVQVFGCGAAQYVTVTGRHLPGTSYGRLEVVADLSWLCKRWHVAEGDKAATALPTGTGPAPDAQTITERVREAPGGALEIAGSWESLDLPSASELWWRLVRRTLRAAENHGEAAVDFLLTRTAFGLGQVDSKDPGRYMRREWVVRDVARIAGKIGNAADPSVFEGFDCEAWEPPQGTNEAPGDILVAGRELEADANRARFLVHEFLPRQGLVEVFGDPSCGKTPFALLVAMKLAAGEGELFGHEIDEGGRVVYLVGEDLPGFVDRMHAQAAELGLDGIPADFFVSMRPAALVSDADRRKWVQAIDRVAGGKRASLLVVDTLSRNFGEGHENDTKDMAAFVNGCEWLTRELGCLVLLVHHKGYQSDERSRGSSVLPAACDAMYSIVRAGPQITIAATKTRGFREPEPVTGTLTVHTVGHDSKGRPITAVTLADREPDPGEIFDELDDEIRKLLDYVYANDGEQIGVAELALAIGRSRNKAKSVIADAEGLGLLKVQKGRGKTVKASYTLTEAALRHLTQNPGQATAVDASELGELLD